MMTGKLGALSRRRFLQGGLALAGLGTLSGCGAVAPWARAPVTVPRIAYITNGALANQPAIRLDALRDGLRQAGYVEGKNLQLELHGADDQAERMADLIANLVRQRVDVIVTSGTQATLAAKQATSSVPIVMTNVGDPVGLGIVTSIARPGGNVTGLTSLAPELSPKRLQLLTECAPTIRRVGILYNADDPGRVHAARETEEAARSLGRQTRLLEVHQAGELASTLAGAIADGVDALMVLQGGPVFDRQGATVVGLAVQHRLPAMYDGGQFTDAGGLMFYGPNFPDLFRRAATYVDRILKGVSPADLPIERPSTFDFVLNLKAAQALGLTIPPSVLLQATEVMR